MTRKRNQHLNFFGRIGRSVYESTISSQQFGEFGVRASFRSISHISTLAHGQVAPRSVGGARDGLDGLPGGEPEAGVALVGGRPAVADVGGGHGEAVVDLRMTKRVFFVREIGSVFLMVRKKIDLIPEARGRSRPPGRLGCRGWTTCRLQRRIAQYSTFDFSQ